MQIDLIGCTSAGKSTLARHILQACHAQGIDILLGEDFVLKQVGLNWIKSHRLRKLLLNLIALFACLITWRNNLEFHRFATHLLFQLPIPPLEKLGLLRNVLKRIGIHEIIRFRSHEQQLILVDEGVLQIAHNLFVHVSVDVTLEQLSTFAGLALLPEAVVYLRQPEELLIDRTMKRGHKRIPDLSHGKVVRFVKQAVSMFDELMQYPAVKNRLVVVDGVRQIDLAANDQDDPMMGLVLRIVQSGFSGATSTQSVETVYVE